MSVFNLRCALWLALFLAGFAVAWCWQANRYAVVIARRDSSHQADLSAIGNAAAAQLRETLANQQARLQTLERLDGQASAEKEQLNAENQALRRAVAAGTRRLRLAGSCRANRGDVSAPAGTAGLDASGTVELAPATGQRVLDLRTALIADQSALTALQRYVREVCLQ